MPSISTQSPRILLQSSLPRFLPRHLTPSYQIQRLSNHSLTSPPKATFSCTFLTGHPRNFTMSSKEFSNTSTGDAPADPYKAKNKDEPSLEEKIETLVAFVSSCKFGMMTTWNATTKLLASRCMAVAAKVSFQTHPKSQNRRSSRSQLPLSPPYNVLTND